MPHVFSRFVALVTSGLVLVTLCLLSTSPAHARRGVAIPAPDLNINPAVNLDEFEVQLMFSINQVRAHAGLKQIRYFDTCVDKISEDWATHIASTGVLEHRDQNVVLQRCRQAWAGEDLVRGTLLTPAAIVDAWMASTSHRHVLLKKRANRAGIAISLDGQGRYIGVLNFSDPS